MTEKIIRSSYMSKTKLSYNDYLNNSFPFEDPHKDEIIKTLLQINKTNKYEPSYLIFFRAGNSQASGWFSPEKKVSEVLKELGQKFNEPFKIPETAVITLSSYQDIVFTSKRGFKGTLFLNKTLKDQLRNESNKNPEENIYFVTIDDKMK